MNFTTRLSRTLWVCIAGVVLSHSAWADEVQIRKNLPKHFPKLPTIDSVSKTPIAGLYEVRMGSMVLYTDPKGDYVLEGTLIDARANVNLTKASINANLPKFNFPKLPFDDAVVWKNGDGSRQLAVFSDPNCGYCKRLEVDLQKLKDVTVYTFIIPVLGPDSVAKSKNIWCAEDKTTAWLNWMLKAQEPTPAKDGCDASAIERNTALSRKYAVGGTPAIVFADNLRVDGAMALEGIEKRLTSLSGK
jgi:thiol:disulfide interchange protein DsbC